MFSVKIFLFSPLSKEICIEMEFMGLQNQDAKLPVLVFMQVKKDCGTV